MRVEAVKVSTKLEDPLIFSHSFLVVYYDVDERTDLSKRYEERYYATSKFAHQKVEQRWRRDHSKTARLVHIKYE